MHPFLEMMVSIAEVSLFVALEVSAGKSEGEKEFETYCGMRL